MSVYFLSKKTEGRLSPKYLFLLSNLQKGGEQPV